MHLEEALLAARDRVAADPESAEAQALLGAILAALSRLEDARKPLERALALEPERPDALNNLGAVLRSQGDLRGAQATFARAVELAPHYAAAVQNLASVLGALGRPAEAIAMLERFVAGGTATAAIHDELGKALWQQGRTPEGIGEFRRALEIDPEYGDAWAHIGTASMEEGRLDDAVPAFLAAIAAMPDRGEFYRALADVDPGAITAEHVAALETHAERESHYALGKIYAGRGDRARSFEHQMTANAAARSQLRYDEPATLQSFANIARVFGAEYLRARRGFGFESTLPIFIFGMPRSGTTLIEQILASHPDVFAAGELGIFEDIATEMLATGNVAVRDIGERYVDAVSKLAPSALRITDKMPGNFRFAGLIHVALPNARMIHARRDPIETCLSCFSNSFAAGGLAWTCDLGELGRYCRGYLTLMEHWRTALPADAMLEVQYEDVVGDLETQARRIVAYCGLAWDDRCLEFYKTERPVKTASVAQVRRPIYRTSLRTADSYGEAIRPLLDALGPIGTD